MVFFNQLLSQNLALSFLILSGAFLLLLVFSIFLYLKLRKAPFDIFEESQAKNLEDILIYQSKTLKSLDKDIQELFNISNQLNILSFKSLHKIGLVRFNPFKDVGGDQSFALALLDGKNNGLLLSSLFTREGTRIYAKAVVGGKAEKHPFTQEEEKAIKLALKKEKKVKSSSPEEKLSINEKE